MPISPRSACLALIREDIDDAAMLFVTTSTADQIEITSPAANTALPTDTAMLVKFKAKARGQTLMQVRFGAVNGPIIHQMQVIVNEIQRLRVVAHAPTINGAVQVNPATGVTVPAQTRRTDAEIRAMFDVPNAIYFHYGIQFVLDAVIDRAGVLALSNQGMVDDNGTEFDPCTRSNRVAGVVNAYFIPQIANMRNNADGTPNEPMNQVIGTANSAVRNPNTFGILISDEALNGQPIAHELGHLLNLVNDPSGQFIHINTVDDPASPGTGREVRSDIVSRRRLMFAFTNLAPDAQRPYRDEAGYGVLSDGSGGQSGGLLTIKNYIADKTDLEMGEVQRTASRLGRPAP